MINVLNKIIKGEQCQKSDQSFIYCNDFSFDKDFDSTVVWRGEVALVSAITRSVYVRDYDPVNPVFPQERYSQEEIDKIVKFLQTVPAVKLKDARKYFNPQF